MKQEDGWFRSLNTKLDDWFKSLTTKQQWTVYFAMPFAVMATAGELRAPWGRPAAYAAGLAAGVAVLVVARLVMPGGQPNEQRGPSRWLAVPPTVAAAAFVIWGVFSGEIFLFVSAGLAAIVALGLYLAARRTADG